MSQVLDHIPLPDEVLDNIRALSTFPLRSAIALRDPRGTHSYNPILLTVSYSISQYHLYSAFSWIPNYRLKEDTLLDTARYIALKTQDLNKFITTQTSNVACMDAAYQISITFRFADFSELSTILERTARAICDSEFNQLVESTLGDKDGST